MVWPGFDAQDLADMNISTNLRSAMTHPLPARIERIHF